MACCGCPSAVTKAFAWKQKKRRDKKKRDKRDKKDMSLQNRLWRWAVGREQQQQQQ